jgi:hypothetical protein
MSFDLFETISQKYKDLPFGHFFLLFENLAFFETPNGMGKKWAF